MSGISMSPSWMDCCTSGVFSLNAICRLLCQNLLNSSLELLGHRSWTHYARNFDDVVQANVAGVLDMFDLEKGEGIDA